MTHATMIGQLRSLLQLTQTEVQIARIRVAQARTDAVRKELRENAENAERRTAEITRELQRLGGVADVVSPLVGRVAAFVKGTFEQAEPVDEALLGDLVLEHQLHDRATYLKALAEASREKPTSQLAERLITAHSATVEWLTTVLAEEALGGPSALRATPVQAVAGGVTRAVNYPVRFARDQVNRALGRVQDTGDQVRTGVTQVAGKAAQFSENARDVLLTGRDASLQRAEQVARRQGDTAAAESVHEARARLGSLSASELPIPDYDNLSASAAASAVKELTSVDDLNKVIHYEEAHKNRHSVVSAAQTRHAALAQEIAGIR
ncbi:ferritin-like domain-containing protein [Actinomycetospora sp. TBRC 11914]|uniref:ferritin-like domain-containing protein n=1 Tax=Actinomycetospora sp. TBRC 11914 TaxID=2729387 RepID=UPI00145D83E5|nr:ferritin-like domain-containing protein [Actinomycetospora sp. TBRC 11914]NMO93743.1 ferritin-like domain-containing protein [Actinomycetospora sp. TBRC 11914]